MLRDLVREPPPQAAVGDDEGLGAQALGGGLQRDRSPDRDVRPAGDEPGHAQELGQALRRQIVETLGQIRQRNPNAVDPVGVIGIDSMKHRRQRRRRAASGHHRQALTVAQIHLADDLGCVEAGAGEALRPWRIPVEEALSETHAPERQALDLGNLAASNANELCGAAAHIDHPQVRPEFGERADHGQGGKIRLPPTVDDLDVHAELRRRRDKPLPLPGLGVPKAGGGHGFDRSGAQLIGDLDELGQSSQGRRLRGRVEPAGLADPASDPGQRQPLGDPVQATLIVNIHHKQEKRVAPQITRRKSARHGRGLYCRPVTKAAPALAIALLLPAWAQAAGPQFQFKIRDKVLAGERPGLILSPVQTVNKVRLTLRPSKGKKRVFESGRILGGATKEFSWKQRGGAVHYEATLTAVDEAGQESTSQFEFDVVVGKGLTLRVDKSLEDIENSEVSFTANRPIARVELQVKTPTGEVVRDKTIKLGPVPAGSPVTVAWAPYDGDILKIIVKAYDPDGFWSGVELSPFWVDIPHEEVEFANGRWEVRPGEAVKLDATLERINDELAKYGKELVLRLYVAGYTDTVGAAGDNQQLSDKRARSIARYFRKRGLKIAIFYQGFGESALYVQTPDSTPEPKNRRALYVLGNAPPMRSAAIPKSHWKPLR